MRCSSQLLKVQEYACFDYPLPAITSLQAAALILSYYAYTDRIRFLMHILCHKTRVFLLRHEEILKDFFIEWKP